ncbi:alcohol oxidase [Auriculariales sp. MPI-PUGE-AT-0066]|nr:alcohol oxidase [Auriculariales sp. MPI-PUGE-AT-0066]
MYKSRASRMKSCAILSLPASPPAAAMPAASSLLATTLLASAIAAVGATTITSDRKCAVDKWYDYVIAGGGLTGITVANKLSAAGNSVLIIEAGIDAKNVPAVYDAERRGELNGTCNWQYQAYGDNNKPLSWKIDSGKCLGGSSSINGMVWYRPTKMEIDALETFGNPGWNWKSLEPHMKAIEHNHPPSAAQRLLGADYNPDVHGFNGPVNVSFPGTMRIPGAQALYKAAIPNVFPGVEVSSDLSDRINTVSASTSWTIWYDAVANINRRSSAAFALLYAKSQQRDKLTVLTEHRVASVIFEKNSATAKGLRFGNPAKGTQLYNVYARKEVILAAGALASAPILERSGVGAKSVHKKFGIKTVVDLPGVGSNLSDQPGTGTSALVNPVMMGNTSLIDGRNLFAPVITLPNLPQLFGADAASLLKWDMTLSIPQRAAALVKAGAAVNLDGAKAILEKATALISAADMPVVEFVGESYPAVMTTVFWPLLPQSRGHIHISSSDPFKDPIIVPRLLSDSFDLKFAVQVARKSRELFTSPVFAAVVQDAYADPADVGPTATDAQYEAWLKKTSFAASHWMGSTSMMPRSLGGVVDPNLHVYGTKKLRVVDAGILPLQITSHTMSTAYSIALEAAKRILQK